MMTPRHFVLGFLASGCLAALVGCGDNSTGTNNDNANNTNPVCGNGQHEGTEECDGADLGGATCQTQGLPGGTLACYGNCTFDTTTCDPPVTCGNGSIDTNEECDGSLLNGQTCGTLGYASGTLTCAPNCQFDELACETQPDCGNGQLDAGEECDDGADNSDTQSDACRLNCVLAHCGDAVIDSGEQCDLGSSNSNLPDAGCRPDCTPSSCGDSIVDPSHGEECEDGNPDNTDACVAGCVNATCGDGFVWTGQEQCDDGNSIDWDGCTSCLPSEFRVHTATAGGQLSPSIDMTPDGTFIVAWSDTQLDGNSIGIGARLFGPEATPLCPDFLVNTTVAGIQQDPAVALAEDGSGVIVWKSIGQDGDSGGIFGQRHNQVGTPLGSEFQVNTVTQGNQKRPKVGMAADGRFGVMWSTDTSAGGCNPYLVRLYDLGGNPRGAPQVVADVGNQDGRCSFSLGMAPNGWFVASWSRSGLPTDPTYPETVGTLYDGDGVWVSVLDTVNTTTAGYQEVTDVSMSMDGSFIITYSSYVMPSTPDASESLAQRFLSNGTGTGAEIQANTFTTGSQSSASTAVAVDGSFVIVWTSCWNSSVTQDGSLGGMYGQRFDATGAKVGGEFQINGFTQGEQVAGRVAMAADGSFVVAWESVGQDGDGLGVYAKRYDASGNALVPGQ